MLFRGGVIDLIDSWSFGLYSFVLMTVCFLQKD